LEKTQIKNIWLLFILLLGLCASAQQSDWVLFDSTAGIKSYRQPALNGQPDTYKAETVLNCRLDVIAVILKDFENYPAWMPNCIKLEYIKSIDDNNLILYYQHHTPWPVHDRDAILHVVTNLDTNRQALYITSQSTNDNPFPLSDNLVHMKKMVAHWQIRYIDESHSDIAYQVISDPGGLIPTSQVNYFSRYLPYKTLLGLKRMCEMPEYIEMAKKSKEKSIVDTFSSELNQRK